MPLVDCDVDRHADAILAIFNFEIRHSASVYDYEPRTLAAMQAWFQLRQTHRCPVLGWEDEAGTLLGFATYGPFRPQPGYKYTVEHSVYVHPDHRRQGLARKLLPALIERAVADDRHVLIGVIDAHNAASIALHESLGFVLVGSLPETGFKFGRWQTAVLYQLTLLGPAAPCDGNP